MRKFLLIIGLFVLVAPAHSQKVVVRNDSVKVKHASTYLELPWATGLNATQASPYDFNGDGLMDLFFFEPNSLANYETGDKISPFINEGGPGQIKYRFAPEYREGFPALEEYALLRDYNCDGKPDIFTRQTSQRMTVYENISGSTTAFKVKTRKLKTDTSQIPLNPNYYHMGEVFWDYLDLPSITDVDGDGDLDILNVPTNPHFIEYNKNMSMEKYGTCDSLDFVVKSTCWGQFLEDTNTVTLNLCDVTNVPNPEFQSSSGSARHSHDAILALDLNGDSVMDLLEGDLDRQKIYVFINGGKKDSSHIVSYTDFISSSGDTAQFETFLHPYHMDVNNDGLKDLIISPFNDLFTDTNSIWYYENTGSLSAPSFTLMNRGLFQNEMIDVGTQSKPIFFDYNQDSLMDIIIGNYGYFSELGSKVSNSLYTSMLALYENIGTKFEPEYKLVDLDFDSISTYPLNLAKNQPAKAYHPAFGDLDGDGDMDMILGDHRGKIHYFENIPTNGITDFRLRNAEFLGIDVGDYSTPQLFDLNGDSLLDLIIGEASGELIYYKNNTTSSLSFVLEDLTLGDVDVKDNWEIEGFSTPFFYRDSLNEVFLLAGSRNGFIRFYDSIIVAGVLSTKFRLLEKRYQDIWDGTYATINGADIDGDSSLDFITGNHSGGIALYTSLDSIYPIDTGDYIFEIAKNNIDVLLFPNPAKDEISIQLKCACPDIFDYHIYDGMGRLQGTYESNNKLTIDLKEYSAGLYVVKGTNKNRSITITERFIKKE